MKHNRLVIRMGATKNEIEVPTPGGYVVVQRNALTKKERRRVEGEIVADFKNKRSSYISTLSAIKTVG